ncbi:hypothetical protein LCL89_07075 [Halobacillus yeomjeoni]|uniref:hypothetical protein n=1 Tax=Halobacillus yeomjeoni TaxID=311194 RepID=UPI001CD4879C|nr:hypothetical protein [Halobacillus yeomjeoni]MCA0983819.1 hypothetical protein [Halobacillus yeomjeoni]
MLVTVKPCFHWIGYHICSALLQEGVHVVGIDRMENCLSDELYMYIGRNSNFQHFYHIEDKENHIHHNDGEKTVKYDGKNLIIETDQGGWRESIDLPQLYGEWMDIPQTEVETEREFQQWIQHSEAVYIGDFLESFIPYLLERGNNRGFSFAPVFDNEKEEKNIHATWKNIHCSKAMD